MENKRNLTEKERKAVKYAYAIAQFEDRRRFCIEDFEAGWDEALKHQWIRVDDRLPEDFEDVFVLFNYNGRMQIHVSCYTGSGKWCYGNRSEILAWMPIPPFDEILNADKDVLKRLKDK